MTAHVRIKQFPAALPRFTAQAGQGTDSNRGASPTSRFASVPTPLPHLRGNSEFMAGQYAYEVNQYLQSQREK
jgi:hypothetical protein